MYHRQSNNDFNMQEITSTNSSCFSALAKEQVYKFPLQGKQLFPSEWRFHSSSELCSQYSLFASISQIYNTFIHSFWSSYTLENTNCFRFTRHDCESLLHVPLPHRHSSRSCYGLFLYKDCNLLFFPNVFISSWKCYNEFGLSMKHPIILRIFYKLSVYIFSSW